MTDQSSEAFLMTLLTDYSAVCGGKSLLLDTENLVWFFKK